MLKTFTARLDIYDVRTGRGPSHSSTRYNASVRNTMNSVRSHRVEALIQSPPYPSLNTPDAITSTTISIIDHLTHRLNQTGEAGETTRRSLAAQTDKYKHPSFESIYKLGPSRSAQWRTRKGSSTRLGDWGNLPKLLLENEIYGTLTSAMKTAWQAIRRTTNHTQTHTQMTPTTDELSLLSHRKTSHMKF